MIDLNVGQVSHSVVADQLMLAIHHLNVPLDHIFTLGPHFVGFAGKLGRLTPIRDAPDKLSLTLLHRCVRNLVHLEEL